MMTKQIYINNTLVNDYISKVEFQDNAENLVDTATIYTKPLPNDPDFIEGLAPVKIILNGETIFKGFVQKITENPKTLPDYSSWTLYCVRDIEQLKHIYISEAFDQEIAGDAVRYLIEKYTDYTTNHVQIW